MTYQCLSESLPYAKDAGEMFALLAHFPNAVWLDSACGSNEQRFEILAALPNKTLSMKDNITTVSSDEVSYQTKDCPLAVLDKELELSDNFHEDIPFFNGAIGYMAYDYGLVLQDIKRLRKNDNPLPEVFFAFYPWVIIVDHVKQKSTLYYQADLKTQRNVNRVLKTLRQKSKTTNDFYLTKRFQSNMSYDAYESAILKIKAHLQRGDCYQVNFSHCFSSDYEGCPVTAYRLLRQKSPVPFAAMMRLQEGDILSLSPELFIHKKQDELTTKPIKGTMPRGDNPIDDERLKQALIHSEKNRAENTMIVDLMRNDLSRVAKPYSVKVPKHLAIESYASVHHLVSTVKAKIEKDISVETLLKSIFPGGSITGAPKKKSMEIIEALECYHRSLYCGSIGYISSSGELCFNIAIRTLLALDGKIFCYAGGGIVIDSQPMEEYEETLAKVSVLTETLSNHQKGRSYQ